MSTADGNSTEGESGSVNPAQTGPGCYRNHEHFTSRHRRPPAQPPLLDLEPPEAPPQPPQSPPHNPPTSPVGVTPSYAVDENDSAAMAKLDEIPSEFECCFCNTKDYKDFIDAENLMPLPTSDFRNPICLEMKLLKSGRGMELGIGGGMMDIGSVDSSDTYASCNTQPFNSQGDLAETPCDPLDSNLYINPLESPSPRGGVKKSASGDTALRSLGASPLEEAYRGFGPPDRGSRGSLNDTPLPKHRKTRFQQPRYGESSGRESQESLETIKRRRPSFMPTKSIATATRLINQHLFGLQALGKPGKNGESRSSLSVDSIDSRTCATPETHRRSKSILKKHESGSGTCSNHKGRNIPDDPETEKLISDTASGASGSDYSPGKSPPALRAIGPLRSPNTTKSHPLPIKFVGISGNQNPPSEMTLLQELLGSTAPPPPLYICPPPPPMDHSPTEETKLLLHHGDSTSHQPLHSS